PSWIVPSRVLLVDNDVTNRGISGQLLQLFGVSFDVAVDGLEAIQWLNGNMYDLVLMAVAMPKIDGVTATSIIRQSDIRTPIVSMSSSAHPQDLLMYRNS
ncbi:CheY-like protein, partial [Peniophora sp. CONT]